MKKISLIIISLLICFSTFSANSENRTEVKTITYSNWSMSVICDGEMIGHLVGEVTIKLRIHHKNNWQLELVRGTLEGTDLLEGENFEINYHGKVFNNWWEEDFRVNLHFIAKGDKGTKLINFGTFDYTNGAVSLRSNCF